mmetsp:Transcript_25318/g.74098  ORF Transcript_25318/g.74098 Transcript_25318/m.74098 type:complete len:113 (-) Transcript_25318:101-439(-)
MRTSSGTPSTPQVRAHDQRHTFRGAARALSAAMPMMHSRSAARAPLSAAVYFKLVCSSQASSAVRRVRGTRRLHDSQARQPHVSASSQRASTWSLALLVSSVQSSMSCRLWW